MASTYSSEPQNGIVQALLTDLYQISMVYSYWESGKTKERSVFDLYFRTNPFQGEYTIFAGLQECISYLQNFKFSESDIKYLRDEVLPKTCKDDFFDYLRKMTTNEVTLYAIPEGTVVFPRVPLMRVEAPLPVAQLVETTLLNLVNYASLVATNAARFRIAAGKSKVLLEFGLRRAQGPDGALSASKYCFIGGFDGTSNVLAGKKFGIPCKGTQAHSFVSSFLDTDEHRVGKLKMKDGTEEKAMLPIAKKWLEKIAPVLDVPVDQTSQSELIALSAFAVAFPTNFVALVDTYNVVRSGLPNFCAVALALNEFGYKAVGVRLDSGDLAYLSTIVRQKFSDIAKFTQNDLFNNLIIVASNDINEETLYSLQQQGHEIDCFGIGTHLVTCQKQPALGCVYKLVEINGEARMKISEEVKKVTIPGHKNAYRLYGTDGKALVDLVQTINEPAPEPNTRALCRDPIMESKRAYVKPARVESLLQLYYKEGKVSKELPTLQQIKEHVKDSLSSIRLDHLRSLNPTPYKVSVSDSLYNFMHQIWLDSAPIGELS